MLDECGLVLERNVKIVLSSHVHNFFPFFDCSIPFQYLFMPVVSYNQQPKSFTILVYPLTHNFMLVTHLAYMLTCVLSNVLIGGIVLMYICNVESSFLSPSSQGL